MKTAVQRLGPVAFAGDFAAYVSACVSWNGEVMGRALTLRQFDAEGFWQTHCWLGEVTPADAVRRLAMHAGADVADVATQVLNAAILLCETQPVETN